MVRIQGNLNLVKFYRNFPQYNLENLIQTLCKVIGLYPKSLASFNRYSTTSILTLAKERRIVKLRKHHPSWKSHCWQLTQRESADYEHWIGEHGQTVYFAESTNIFEKDMTVVWNEEIRKYLRFGEYHIPFSSWQPLFIKLTRKGLNTLYKVCVRNLF